MSQKHSNMRNYSGQHRKSLCELNTLKRYSVSVRMLVLAFSSPGLSTVWQSTAVDSQWCSCNSCWHKCKERKTHKQRKAAAAASFTYIVEIHPIMAKVQIWKQFDSDLTLSYVGKKGQLFCFCKGQVSQCHCPRHHAPTTPHLSFQSHHGSESDISKQNVWSDCEFSFFALPVPLRAARSSAASSLISFISFAAHITQILGLHKQIQNEQRDECDAEIKRRKT